MGTPYINSPRPGFSFDLLEISVGDQLTKAPGASLSLVIEASFSSSSPLPTWVTERPTLLVSGVPDFHKSNASFRVILQSPETVYSIVVDANQVRGGNLCGNGG